MSEEIVALYDDDGRPSGTAPRSRVRAENLRHAATGIVVRDSWGRIYVHRRTDTKDVFPGRHDFACGGVLAAGETPDEGAVRELAEELGITGVPLTDLGTADYADDHTRYRAFRYLVTWDGPVRWQPEEVASGEWMTLEALTDALADPAWCVPDTPAVFAEWLRERRADRVRPEQGWDCDTEIVEGRWVDRRPARPAIERQLRAEVGLMGRIADRLPLEVPTPIVLDDEPLRLRHRLVRGRPADPGALTAEDGRQVGSFLRVLHDTDPATYADLGLPSAAEWRTDLLRLLGECRERVLPLVTPALADAASHLLDDVTSSVRTAEMCLTHADLGPEHLLTRDGRVTGVIDWGDAGPADPARDLSWVLFGTAAEFADAVRASYGVTDDLARRGLAWHRFGPWFEAHWGVTGGPEDYQRTGIAGIEARLGGRSS